MSRTAGFTLVIFAGGGLLTVGLINDVAWLTGLSMLAVGLAFALGFWVAPRPVDPNEPAYGTRAAALAPQRRLLPEAAFEGIGVMGAITIGSALLAIALIYEIAWLTGLAMLAMGAMFAIGYWRKPKASA